MVRMVFQVCLASKVQLDYKASVFLVKMERTDRMDSLERPDQLALLEPLVRRVHKGIPFLATMGKMASMDGPE